MKDSKRLRHIDRWIGSSLCFFLTGLVRLRGKRAFTPIKRVLVIELFEMGAAIMIAPSLSHILKSIPNVEIHVLTSESTLPVWEMLRLVPKKNVHAIGGKGLFPFVASAFRNFLTVRRISPDLIIDYNLFLRFTAIFSGCIPAKSRAGFYKYEVEGLYRGNIYDKRCYFNQNEHISKNFLALTKTALKGTDDSPGLKERIPTSDLKLPVFVSDANARHSVENKLAQLFPEYKKFSLLVLSPDVGPTLAVRNYPPASFAVALDQVLKTHPNVLTVMVGTQYDLGTAQTIQKHVSHPRCIQLCGQTNFAELLELLAMAKLVVCNDNGIAHFSALTHTPSVALFSTDSPFVYGPLAHCTIVYSYFHCSPCIFAYNHKTTRCQDNQCLKTIPPEQLADFLTKGLRNELREGTINNDLPYL